MALVTKSKKRSRAVQVSCLKTNNRDKFGRSLAYVKTVMKDPKLKATYEAAAKRGLSGYDVAARDAYEPPVIRSVSTQDCKGMRGDNIFIDAVDDFRVACVYVSIYKAVNKLLETGEAAFDERLKRWVYVTTASCIKAERYKLIVVAKDLPGNEAVYEQVVYLK
jgi:hypothetical protein